MNNEQVSGLEVMTKLAVIETRLDIVIERLEELKGIEEKATEAYNLSKSNEKRLDKIEDKNQWAFRTSIGAIIGAVISGVVSIIFAVIKLK